jgi:hypothetical protein
MRGLKACIATLLLAPLLPAQSSILEKALGNEVRQQKERAQYFYREHVEHRRPNGRLNFTQDYEWIFLEGEPFRKQVARNGKALKGRRLREEEERMRMTAAERRADAARPRANLIKVGNLSGQTILTRMDHTEAGEEAVDGRPAWVIRAEPKPGHEAVAYRMTFWIDQEDIAIAQLRYDVIGRGVDSLPGSWLITTYTRLKEGLWFKKTLQGEFRSAPPRPRSHWKQFHTFRDFRRFDAESTVTFEAK